MTLNLKTLKTSTKNINFKDATGEYQNWLILEDLKKKHIILDSFHTGSRVICNPPVTDTDDDWLILIEEDQRKHIEAWLNKEKFVLGGSIRKPVYRYKSLKAESLIALNVPTTDFLSGYTKYKPDLTSSRPFISYRKDELNLIITSDVDFYYKFQDATKLAKALNLKVKQDRITLFKAIIDDEFPA